MKEPKLNHCKLSVSIVHHDGLPMLENCLRSLYRNGFQQTLEVVVVDNVSTDGAVEMIRSRFPQVKLLQNTDRHGFGFNQNTGINACSGEYIFILNDDTDVHEGALQTLCSYLDEHKEVALVGPRLLNPDGSLQQSCYKFPSPMRCLFENFLLTAAFPDNSLFGDYRGWSHSSTRLVEYVVGSAMMVRRAAIDDCGLFDTLFFMYAEETDWQLRMRAKGWQIAFCSEAEVMHIGGKSSEQMKDRQFCEAQRSYVKYMNKHFGVVGLAVQRPAMIAGSCLRLFIWSILFAIGKRQKAAPQIERWKRLLAWWLGMGPREGIAELTAQMNASRKAETPST